MLRIFCEKEKAIKILYDLGINSYDPKEDVKWFCDKHKVAYNVLINGAQQYGVSAFPTIFIIDKR